MSVEQAPRRHVWTKRRWNGTGTPVQCCVNCGFMKWAYRDCGVTRTQYIEVRHTRKVQFDVKYRPCDGHGPPEGLAIRRLLARHGVDVNVQYYCENDCDFSADRPALKVRLDVPEQRIQWLEDLLAGRLERRLS